MERDKPNVTEEREQLRSELQQLRAERDWLRARLEDERVLSPAEAPPGGLLLRTAVVTSDGWAHEAFEAVSRGTLPPGASVGDSIRNAARRLGEQLARRYEGERER